MGVVSLLFVSFLITPPSNSTHPTPHPKKKQQAKKGNYSLVVSAQVTILESYLQDLAYISSKVFSVSPLMFPCSSGRNSIYVHIHIQFYLEHTSIEPQSAHRDAFSKPFDPVVLHCHSCHRWPPVHHHHWMYPLLCKWTVPIYPRVLHHKEGRRGGLLRVLVVNLLYIILIFMVYSF